MENSLTKINSLNKYLEFLIKNLKQNNYKLLLRKNFLLLIVNYNFLSNKKDYSVLLLEEKEDSKNKMKTYNKMFKIKNCSVEKNFVTEKPNKNINFSLLNHKRKLTSDNKEKEIPLPKINNEGFFLRKRFEEYFNRIFLKSPSEFDKNNLIRESNIIYNEKEVSLINNEIDCPPTKVKKYKLIFQASKDGDSALSFHSICDKISNIIVLVETKQGKRFGGYTSVKFGGTSHLKKDNKAFLFSLDNQKIYKINSDKYAIYCYPNSGPCFSYGSLYIPNNFFINHGKTGAEGTPYNFSFDFELNDGKENFLVNELEIFRVNIDDN